MATRCLSLVGEGPSSSLPPTVALGLSPLDKSIQCGREARGQGQGRGWGLRLGSPGKRLAKEG